MPSSQPLLATALTLVLLLAGCAPGEDTAEQADSGTVSTDAGQATTDGPAQTSDGEAAVTEPPPDRPVDDELLVRLDGAGVTGLATGTLTDQEAHLHLTWPVVPGAEPLTEDLEAQAERLADQFREEHPTGTDIEVVARPELNRTWSFAGYSEEIVGVLHEGFVFEGASTAQAWRTTWWDPQTEQVLEPTDLIAPDRQGDFEGLVTRLVTEHYPASVLPEEMERELADDGPSVVAFTRDGDLAVGFDAYEVAVGSAGPVLVSVPAREAEALLSDEGRQARDAALHPTDPRLGSNDQSPDAEAPSPGPDEPSPGSEEPSPGSDEQAPDAAPPSAHPTSPAPGGRVDCSVASCVAITYDDGPGASTEQVLAAFEARGQRATFFVLGQQTRIFPGVVARIAAGGHEIGVHTWDHPSLPRLAPDQIRSQLSSTVAEIRAAGGGEVRLFRPPYGATNETVRSVGQELGLTQVLWDIDTLDWKDRDSAVVTERVLAQTRRGSIVLMHDIHPSTAQAAPAVIDGLLERGFTLVTVSELLAGG